MFDFAWSEVALIGVVALVLIGPKDLPIAIKTITAMIKKARRMAAEFQTHVDDMVKDADLGEVRDQFREIRNMDIRGTIARAVDKDGTIRQAMADPIRTPPPPAIPAEGTPLPEHVMPAASMPAASMPAASMLGAFTPEPSGVEHSVADHPVHSAAPALPEPPAFIPPDTRPAAMPAFVPPGAGSP